MDLEIIGYLAEMRETMVDVVEGEGKAIKEARLKLKGLLFRTRVEESAEEQEAHDGLGVELEGLMATFVVQKAIKLEFVVNDAWHDVTVVFTAAGVHGNLLIGTNLNSEQLVSNLLLFQLFGDLGEVGDGIGILFFQLIEVADGTNRFGFHFTVPITITMDDGEISSAGFRVQTLFEVQGGSTSVCEGYRDSIAHNLTFRNRILRKVDKKKRSKHASQRD
jgi:hypothetical protein